MTLRSLSASEFSFNHRTPATLRPSLGQGPLSLLLATTQPEPGPFPVLLLGRVKPSNASQMSPWVCKNSLPWGCVKRGPRKVEQALGRGVFGSQRLKKGVRRKGTSLSHTQEEQRGRSQGGGD